MQLSKNPFEFTLSEKANQFLLDERPLKSSNATKEFSPTGENGSISNAEWAGRESFSNGQNSFSRNEEAFTLRKKTFPSFFPLVRHDIQQDVPAAGQRLANLSFSVWKVLCAALCFNLLTEGTLFWGKITTLTSLILGVAYSIAIPPLSFYFVHLHLYKSLQKNSIGRFVVFFSGALFSFGFFALMMVGVIDGEGGGLLGTFSALRAGKGLAGTLCILSALLSGALTACYAVLLVQSVAFRRSQNLLVGQDARPAALTASQV